MIKGRTTKWLDIVLDEESAPKRKTGVYLVYTKDGRNNYLGHISWYGAWRKYSFFPIGTAVFETTCLRDIAQFMDDLMKDHANERNIKKIITTLNSDKNEA